MEMLDILKHEGSAWAIIAACKGGKEEIKAFEKKVKIQFGLVPFEDITPVAEEVDLEKVEKDKKEAEVEKEKAEEERDVKEKEKNDKEEKEFKEKLAKEKKGAESPVKEAVEDTSENGDSMDATVPLETPVKSDHKVIADEVELDETLPCTPKGSNEAESNGDLKRKKAPRAGPASKVSKVSDVEEGEKTTKEGTDEESEVSNEEAIENDE